MSSSMRSRSVHHESAALGRLEQAERAPHPLLEGIVRRYCGYDHDCAGTTRRREVAQDEVTIILSLGSLLRIGGPDHPSDRYASFVAALTDTFAITEPAIPRATCGASAPTGLSSTEPPPPSGRSAVGRRARYGSGCDP